MPRSSLRNIKGIPLRRYSRREFLGEAAIVGMSGSLTDWTDVHKGPSVPAGSAANSTQRSVNIVDEPDMRTALGWWGELPNKWTPIGWKDHLFRFNVLFNGTLIAQPDLNRRTSLWAGQGIQLSFMPSPSRTFGVGSNAWK